MPEDMDDIRDEVDRRLQLEALARGLREAGFADVSPKLIGETTQVIDFKIEAPAPGFETRELHASSVVIGDGQPRSFVLRFPEVDLDFYSPGEVTAAMNVAAARVDLPTRQWMEESKSVALPHIETVTDDEDLPGGAELAEGLATIRDTFFNEFRDFPEVIGGP